jgi:hypothetical protein
MTALRPARRGARERQAQYPTRAAYALDGTRKRTRTPNTAISKGFGGVVWPGSITASSSRIEFYLVRNPVMLRVIHVGKRCFSGSCRARTPIMR